MKIRALYLVIGGMVPPYRVPFKNSIRYRTLKGQYWAEHDEFLGDIRETSKHSQFMKHPRNLARLYES